MIYSIKKTGGARLWTVGVLIQATESEAEHEWIALKDFKSEDLAFRFINYLNGGTGTSFPGDF